MNELLNEISYLLFDTSWFAPLLAFIGGILTAFTPCSLSSIPLVIVCTGGMNTTVKKSFLLSIVFSIGMCISFIAIGIVITMMGRIFQLVGSWWYILLGILMIIMALQMLGVFTFIKPIYLNNKNNKKGYIGAFVAGLLGGVFASPCATPVLVAIFAIASTSTSLLWSILLLSAYAIGNCVLVIIAGTSIGITKKIVHNKNYGMISKVVQIVMSVALILLALYMFYLGF